MNTTTTPIKRAKPPGLDSVLEKHWNDTMTLTISSELPPDPASLTASAKFTQAVLDASPQWVMLPVPPQTRDAAKRHVASLRRRNLNSVMRAHPDSATSWSIWASAKDATTP